ncbi:MULTISPECIES: hypothetical protein [unclassified Frankia]
MIDNDRRGTGRRGTADEASLVRVREASHAGEMPPDEAGAPRRA